MKKMMAAFFGGCVMIGIGLGVFAVELTGWKLSDRRDDLRQEPLNSYEYEINFDTSKKTDVEIYYQNSQNMKDVSVMADKNYTERIKIVVNYRGAQPNIWPSSYGGTDATRYDFYVDINNYNDIGQMYRILKTMFENKTYYIHGENCLVENVVIYTAHPENIRLVDMYGVPLVIDQVE